MTTSTMTTYHGMDAFLESVTTDIYGNGEVDVRSVIRRFREKNYDPAKLEVDNDTISRDPVKSTLCYILAAFMHRKFNESKPKHATYCFHKICKAICEFQNNNYQRLLQNGVTVNGVTDILIKLMIEAYNVEFKRIHEEEDKDLKMNENVEAIGFAATWITETCLHLRWKKEADHFYEIGVRFEKVSGNLEDLARLYKSRAKYLAMIGSPQEEVYRFLELAEQSAIKMDESKSENRNRLLYFIEEFRQQYAETRN